MNQFECDDEGSGETVSRAVRDTIPVKKSGSLRRRAKQVDGSKTGHNRSLRSSHSFNKDEGRSIDEETAREVAEDRNGWRE